MGAFVTFLAAHRGTLIGAARAVTYRHIRQ